MTRFFDTAVSSQFLAALKDMGGIVSHWRSWLTLGNHDIKHRYRGSVLGPFWITLSMAALIGALYLVYGGVFNGDENGDKSRLGYIYYLAASMPIWYLLSDCIKNGCVCFSEEPLLKQIKLPYSVYVARVIWRNFVIFIHNIGIFVIVLVLFRSAARPHFALLAIGLIILFVNVGWLIVIFGTICARFRDVAQIVENFIGMLFFISPIMWTPSLVKDKAYIIDYNLLNHFMELVRQPILGAIPTAANYQVSLISAAIGWLVALAVFTKFRRRLAYWV